MSVLFKTSMVIFVFLTSFSIGNNDCKVLLEPISESYSGRCRDGLAHGRGTARGVDTYVGMFREGLPHGRGTYTYQNGSTFKGQFKNGMKHGSGEFTLIAGDQKIVQKGYWQHDEFIGGAKPTELYRITERSNITSYSIKKIGDQEDRIKISFFSAHTKYIPTDLEIITATGELQQETREFSIYHFNIPNHVSIRYIVVAAGIPKICALSFVIMQPGTYEVVISND